MNKEDFTELLTEVGADEQDWIDFKEDYFVGGVLYQKAEFIKDIASIANTVHTRSPRYILVGVTDGGDLIGITESKVGDEGDSRKHLFDMDESNLQETVTSHLSPSPDFSIHTFENDGKRFAAIQISQVAEPPAVVSKEIQEDSTTHLRNGEIYLRSGSGKKSQTGKTLRRCYNIELRSIEKTFSIPFIKPWS
ncbi:AlbA family DNA-binding domain-containing protein [Halobaculum rubrum]|uniref:AlbA family DNA-binding domain-containing protein n=1 Tax=Halobaculum rubrum TaxID=2872158 RepID=UPI001CA4578D|nr:ATP-binding protein [Halobaculum rubrum]QZX99810.1 ATP-binding protein [Halobaculum rubrum]QZX99847.1 ATP-binding protein [Halobaculum rubrum]